MLIFIKIEYKFTSLIRKSESKSNKIIIRDNQSPDIKKSGRNADGAIKD